MHPCSLDFMLLTTQGATAPLITFSKGSSLSLEFLTKWHLGWDLKLKRACWLTNGERTFQVEGTAWAKSPWPDGEWHVRLGDGRWSVVWDGTRRWAAIKCSRAVRALLGLYPQENGVASKVVSNRICFLQYVAVKLEVQVPGMLETLRWVMMTMTETIVMTAVVALTPIIYWTLIQG